MRLTVLPNSSIPVYRQLYDQIAAQILSGKLAPGEALPPIRSVSKELGISVITVRGAWDALLSDALIETRAGSGCFAADLSEERRSELRHRALEGPLKELAETSKSLGFSKEETLKLICEELER